MHREIIRPAGFTANPVLAPAARFGNVVYTAGMVGHDPATGRMAGDDIRAQARQTMTNLQAALEAAGTSLDNALKVTAFVADLADRPAFNEVYLEFFASEPPPRTCIQGGYLGEGVLVEVEVVAGIPT
ncbi:MAG: RidA family protein [Thermomicrobiales bacterium]|nr:RidA family protein [Thermomicrobiales bacterium]